MVQAATLSPFSVHPAAAWSPAITDRPVLAKWLTGADATHPLLSPEMTDRFLDALERIAAPVDAANLVRPPTKIKAFRTLKTRTELLEQRAELLIGPMLARGGVPFEFGKDHPDYVLGRR